MSAKELVAHLVSVLPETLNFEEILEALSMIYSDRHVLEGNTPPNSSSVAA
jgi:hypothetical protein